MLVHSFLPGRRAHAPTSRLRQLARDTRGAGFVEYIILVGLVALFCIVAYKLFGSSVSAKVKEQAEAVQNIK
jgi:pilus assembly protein Flp/PilA